MFDSPRLDLSVPSTLRNYIQPTFGHGLRIWWAFFWPTSLISAVMTFALNYSLRRIYEVSTIPGYLLRPIFKYDAYVLSYAVALFVMDYILQKKFRHFRIALLSNHGGEGAQELDSTLSRAVRVWWTYSWRTIVYRVITAFVISIPIGVFLGLFSRSPLLHALANSVVAIGLDGAVGLFVIYSNILDDDFGDFSSLSPPFGKRSRIPCCAGCDTRPIVRSHERASPWFSASLFAPRNLRFHVDVWAFD